jgi:hypothetical protein
MLNRIEPTVEKTLIRGGVRLKSGRTNAIVRHGVAPAWRSNARRFKIHHPGDYATLNSNQSRDSTPTRLGAEIMPVTSRGSSDVSRIGMVRLGLPPNPRARLGKSGKPSDQKRDVHG